MDCCLACFIASSSVSLSAIATNNSGWICWMTAVFNCFCWSGSSSKNWFTFTPQTAWGLNGGVPHLWWLFAFHSLSCAWSLRARSKSHSQRERRHVPCGSLQNSETFPVCASWLPPMLYLEKLFNFPKTCQNFKLQNFELSNFYFYFFSNFKFSNYKTVNYQIVKTNLSALFSSHRWPMSFRL